jgi:UDP-N-acetylmuramoyl-tripeptide--D-alanyl-D-alanine ligase
MRRLLQLKLKILSRLILKKYQPDIVAITGSIGKTTAKEAISLVLSSSLPVRSSAKNHNNEIGVPLTIIGSDAPGSSLLNWFLVFLKALRLIVFYDPTYPKILILEMGIDRPGDMKYLTTLAPPTVSVMTALSHSHLEYFGTLQNIKKEKQILIEALDDKGLGVLNYDNEDVRSMKTVNKAKSITYGFNEKADLRAQELRYQFESGTYDFAGASFKVGYEGSLVPVQLPYILSEAGIYASLAAMAVALRFNLNLMDIVAKLKDFQMPPGRMRLLPGIKYSFLIDDTYNSSPESSLSALRILGKMQLENGSKKYAVLGDMLEIGSYTEEGHALVGEAVYEQKIDYLISVGERSRDIDRGAKALGMSEDNVFHFDKAEAAGLFVQNRIKEGDLILIKGSQGIRMEKIVKELMAEPNKAKDLLVRQEPNWQ